MRVGEWMTACPVTVSPSAPIQEARSKLYGHGFRHLPVVGDGKLVGIVSDRDVTIHDHELQQALSLMQSEFGSGLHRRVAAVMSAPPATIGPDETVDAAARLMMSQRISALPVVDQQEFVGIITTTDCLRALLSLPTAERRSQLSAIPPD